MMYWRKSIVGLPKTKIKPPKTIVGLPKTKIKLPKTIVGLRKTKIKLSKSVCEERTAAERAMPRRYRWLATIR